MPSSLNQIEYFHFEKEFASDQVRCIPMIVRFRLDACGIKLKLSEWSKMTIDERIRLAVLPVRTVKEILEYKSFLEQLIFARTGNGPTLLEADLVPVWTITDVIPQAVQLKLSELGIVFSLTQWQGLGDLERFAIVKLARPGHENRNFPIAIREFTSNSKILRKMPVL